MENSPAQTRLLTAAARDGVVLSGKLDLPAGSGPVEKLVLFISGSGPNTCDDRRRFGETEVCYFDLFARQLGTRGAAFFRWNTRGVAPDPEPPLFYRVDEAVYQTYLPDACVGDIGTWLAVLRQEPRLEKAEVWLLGWSEGTILAPLAALRFPGQVAGLALCGYCNDRLDEILEWQQTGGSSMVFYRTWFDTDGDGAVSRAEFEADPWGAARDALPGVEFEALDLDGDGLLTRADLAALLAPEWEALRRAIDRGDDGWLAGHYDVRLTSAWFRAHRQLPPNRETLPRLELPICIFHGGADASCPVEGALAIRDSFARMGRGNLTVKIYPGYDHDLRYTQYPVTGTMSRAFEDLFDCLSGNRRACVPEERR